MPEAKSDQPAATGLRRSSIPGPRGLPASDFAWLGLAPTALLLLGALLWLAAPLSDVIYRGPTFDYFSGPAGLLNPEPVEGARFVLAVSAPILLSIAILIRARSGTNPGPTAAVIAVQLSGLVLVIWCLAKQKSAPDPLPASWGFDPAILPLWSLLLGSLAGIILTVVALRVPEWSLPRAWLTSEHPRLALAAAAALTALWLLPAVFTNADIGGAQDTVLIHTPYHFEEYLAVLNSRTPLVDFIAQYDSLLPLLLAPVLSTVGASITSFTILMTVLSLGALLAVYAVFALVTERAWAALALYVPLLATSLYPIVDEGGKLTYNANIYSILPGRYFGPLVLGWLCARHLRKGRPAPWLIFAAAGLVVLNNVDFGFPALAATIAALWLGSDSRQPARGRARQLSAHAALGLITALALVSLVTLARTSSLPHLGLLLYFPRLFGQQGFGLIPMPELGLHVVLYLTFSGALLTASVRHVSGTPNRPLTGMLAFSGILGLGAGSYYAGRSATSNIISLFPVWGLAVALLALVSVGALRAARLDREHRRRVVLPAMAALAALATMATAAVRFPEPWRQIDRLASSDGTPCPASEPSPSACRAWSEGRYESPASERFVRARTVPGESIEILGGFGHGIADDVGVVDVTPFTAPSIVTAQQLERALGALRDDQGCKVFSFASFPESRPYLRRDGFVRVAHDRSKSLTEWERKATGCDT
jgi:hypothetical protein